MRSLRKIPPLRPVRFNVMGVNYTMTFSEIGAAQEEVEKMALVSANEALRSGMRSALRVLRRGLISRLPTRRSGKLRRSIRTKISLGVRRVVGKLSLGAGGVFYARFLEQGTGSFGPRGKPFTIKPSTKKAIKIPGVAHPVKSAKVRGIKPMRMVQRTEREDMNAARQAFKESFNDELRRVRPRVWRFGDSI